MKRLIRACSAFGLALGLAMAAGTAGASAEQLSLRLATEGSYAPFNFTRPDGTLDGFEVELANELCKRLDAKCEVVAQEWDGIIPGLIAKKYDGILAGMSITAERMKVVDFSVPYEQGTLGFAVLDDSPLMALDGAGDVINIEKHPDQLEAVLEKWKPLLKGKTIGVQGSTIGANFLDKYLSDTVEIREYKTTEEHDLDLLNGRVDANFASKPNFAATMEKPEFKNMKLVGTNFTGGVFGNGVGVALRKDDQDLKAKFDKAITDAAKDGTIRTLSMKWFKVDTSPILD